MTGRDLLRALPIVVLVLAGVAIGLWRSTSTPSLAESGGPGMAIAIEGGGAVCDAMPHPTTCNLSVNTTFTVGIDATAPPGAGYVGFQSALFYAGLTYEPRALDVEITWPESAVPARFPGSPTGSERSVDHGDLSAANPPFPVSNHAGRLVDLHLRCPMQSATLTLALLPYSPSGHLFGAGYRDVATGLPVAAKTAGQVSIDFDGDGTPEATDVADSVEIICGLGGPTNTPPQPATPTRTATRTRTPTPEGVVGDASCDEIVNSIDAALVLQLVADLLQAFGCDADVDVNGDGRVDAIDAALILQFDAGFLDSLPP
jgi:hypothetical protein